MRGKRFIHTLRLQNFLSYGAEGVTIELQPLNVLIGPNGSGKSNLIEAIGLLRAAPIDLAAAVREGGGVSEWLWKGGNHNPIAELEATVDYPEGNMPLRYRLSLASVGQRLEIVDEAIENQKPLPGYDQVFYYYRYQHGRPILNVRTVIEDQPGSEARRVERSLRRQDLLPDQSVLAQRKDPDQYPELTYLGAKFADIRLYTEWNMGRFAAPRRPQKPDLRNDFLEPDASNLGLVLNSLQKSPKTKQLIIEKLKRFYDSIEDITTSIEGGTVQIYLHERGLGEAIPASRISDGTLRYLCLLTILCHPSPPPLICIEEPELGLHPDSLSTMAELLLEASKRTQLIVTTHSDALVSGLSETPEAILVCERDERGTRLRHLEADRLQAWLKDYSLGDLWRMGELGGTP